MALEPSAPFSEMRDPGAAVVLLRAVPVFAALDDAELADMAKALEEEHYAAGEVVFAEGDPGDRLLIVADGRAELSVAGSVGTVPLATLERGDLVGEQALLAERTGRRNASLTATTPLTLLAMSEEAFDALLAGHRSLRDVLEHRDEELSTDRFIARVGPFIGLDAATRRALSGHVIEHTLEPGQVLMRQGERSDSCYLVRSGSVEVVVADAQGNHTLATLGAGNIVGEMAMLTDAPRSATVRAGEPCDVLELRRADLDAVLAGSRATQREFSRLARSRQCPRRDPLVLVSERISSEGETITTLKHPERLTYHRLSERGRFIWDNLDGVHDLKALTHLVLVRYGEFAPGAIADIVSGLSQSGMVLTTGLRSELDDDGAGGGRTDRLLRRARELLETELSLRDVDRRLTRAYDAFGWIFFTRAALVLLVATMVAGLVAFAVEAGDAHATLAHEHKQALLWLIPSIFVSIVVHETAHAFTVKSFGREVHRAGIGWYWFGPIAFVDTTDMWLEGRRRRILVSSAGPAADLVLGGIAAIAAVIVSDKGLAAALWIVAVPCYLAVVANLNPLLEFDGYHVLSDALDRPNLRSEALGWLGGRFRGSARSREPVGRHRVDLAYSVGAILYIVFNAVVIVAVYRLTVEGALGSVMPAWIAITLGWVLAGVVSLLAILAVSGELRGLRKAR
jgi:CRP-like cAMP-binding protein/Zn-dependent protease